MSREQAEHAIRALAERFRVSSKRSTFDRVADTFARLSDTEVIVDDVEALLIHLLRRGAVDEGTALSLHAAYLNDGK